MTQLGSGVCIATVETKLIFAAGEEQSRPVEKCSASPLIYPSAKRSSLVHNRFDAVLCAALILQLVFGASCQLPTLAGRELSRTIPLADINDHDAA
jgi:hypothetical protein